jgi:hypothetical protein
VRRQIGGHVHAIELIVVGLSQIGVHLIFDDNMAGGTGAISATGVFQMNAEIQRDVEQRFRLSMAFIRQLAGLEFNRFADREEGNLRHCLNYTSRTCVQMALISINMV